jgi:4-amino-4-deoxy-L-arabinose transferase-like glycosyltransferase
MSLIVALFFGFMLGTRPLSAPDEGRYTEIPREMVVSQDYLTPRLNGVKYFEKPPLMYWLTAASIHLFGVKEWSVRLWPALLGLLSCLMVYVVGAHFYSRLAGWFGGLILASNILFYAHSRLLILDMGVTFFLSLSLFSFLWATQSTKRQEQTGALVLFFIAAAGSTLTKGLIGIVIPGAIILLWTLLTKKYQAMMLAFNPWGILLFLGLAAPWHILIHIKNPEFSEFYFIHEHLLRYLTPIHGRSQPVWFFIPVLLIGWFPWTSFLLLSLQEAWQRLRTNPVSLFFILWAGFIFVFFSLSHSKLIPYILPAFPPLAVLIGNQAATTWQNNILPRWVPLFTAVLTGGIGVAVPVVLTHQGLNQIQALYPYRLAVMMLMGLGGLLFLFFTVKPKAKPALVATCLMGGVLLPILNAAWPQLDRRSVKKLAETINTFKKAGDHVVVYGRYYQDLPPYIQQKVIVVGWQGELSFGMSVEDTSRWMMDQNQFLKVYNSLGTVYIVTRKEFRTELESLGLRNLTILAETEKDILLTNIQ